MQRKQPSRIAWAASLVMAALILFDARQVYSQEGIVVKDAGVVVNFGKQITFQARIESALPIKQASLLFREVNEGITRVETVQVGADGAVTFIYDASQNVLPPFSTIVFWYQVTLMDDRTYTSAPILFRYNDTRFPWRDVSSGLVTVHWYDGDDAFGQAALDAAGTSLLEMDEIIPLTLDQAIDIYIYSSVTDLQGALQLGGEDWTGGHANPKLGVVMVAIAPGARQSVEMETEIPHELAHVMLYRSLGGGYERLPAWLREGIASNAELYPNPDYAQALTIAAEKDSLLRFSELCDSFPPDSGRAFLAYAQSQSFTNYLRGTYGTTGISALASAYMDGLDCELGATRALGSPLSQLDNRWRESALGQNPAGAAFRNLSPFVLLMILVMIVPVWGAIDMFRERRKRGRKSK